MLLGIQMMNVWKDAVDRFATRGFVLGVIVWLSYVAPILPSELPAGDAITVWLTSGRTFTASVDAKSNDQQLVLRFGEGDVTIRRPIDWQRITKAEQNEQPLAIDDLKALAKKAASEPVAEQPAEPRPAPPAYQGVFAEPKPQAVMGMALAPSEPIRTLAADAFVANWDRDVENDGLVVQLYPLDRGRQITPVNGTLEVELFAPELRRFHEAPHSRGVTMEQIGRWSAGVNSSEITNRGYTFELPFQAVHPQFSDRTLPSGIVHVKLSVPGEGVFETTLDLVRIRPWSPLRDGMYRNTGRRFLPTEQTGRGVGTAQNAGR